MRIPWNWVLTVGRKLKKIGKCELFSERKKELKSTWGSQWLYEEALERLGET